MCTISSRQAQHTVWYGHLNWVAYLNPYFKHAKVFKLIFFARLHEANSNLHHSFVFKEILKQIAGLPTWNQLDMQIHFYCVWPNWGMFQRNKVGKIVLLQCNSPNIYLDFIVFLSFFDLHKLLNGSLSESELFLWQWRKKVDKS